jgi:hypothetical protein
MMFPNEFVTTSSTSWIISPAREKSKPPQIGLNAACMNKGFAARLEARIGIQLEPGRWVNHFGEVR